jgi:hypothetical protein
MIAGHLGELVYLLLGHEVPLAGAELLADVRLDLVEAGEGEHDR